MSARAIVAVGLLALLGGCAKEPPPLYPLTGLITQNGKPVTGGLIFMPESGDWGGMVVNANVKPDGTFTAETSRTTPKATTVQPGIPAGRYKVAYHPPGDGQKVGTEYEFPDPITVEARDNTLSLVLPDQLPSQKPKENTGKKGGPEAKPAPKTDE